MIQYSLIQEGILGNTVSNIAYNIKNQAGKAKELIAKKNGFMSKLPIFGSATKASNQINKLSKPFEHGSKLRNQMAKQLKQTRRIAGSKAGQQARNAMVTSMNAQGKIAGITAKGIAANQGVKIPVK